MEGDSLTPRCSPGSPSGAAALYNYRMSTLFMPPALTFSRVLKVCPFTRGWARVRSREPNAASSLGQKMQLIKLFYYRSTPGGGELITFFSLCLQSKACRCCRMPLYMGYSAKATNTSDFNTEGVKMKRHETHIWQADGLKKQKAPGVTSAASNQQPGFSSLFCDFPHFPHCWQKKGSASCFSFFFLNQKKWTSDFR